MKVIVFREGENVMVFASFDKALDAAKDIIEIEGDGVSVEEYHNLFAKNREVSGFEWDITEQEVRESVDENDEFYETLCEASSQIEAGIERAKDVLRKSPFFKDKRKDEIDFEVYEIVKNIL